MFCFFTNDFLSSGVTGAPVDIPSILWRPLQAARRGLCLVQISILGGARAAQFVHNQSQRINNLPCLSSLGFYGGKFM